MNYLTALLDFQSEVFVWDTYYDDACGYAMATITFEDSEDSEEREVALTRLSYPIVRDRESLAPLRIGSFGSW